jgi:hypothetical protein
LTSQNTSEILNTIKPVTRAFTDMDMAILVMFRLLPQVVVRIEPSGVMYVGVIAAIHVARGKN